MQLDKAQTKYLQWQNAGKGGPERKRLHGEVDEECRSISWQVILVFLKHFKIQDNFSKPYRTAPQLKCTCISILIEEPACSESTIYCQVPDISAKSFLQVDEMEKAVDVAESNMTRFGLTQQEVASRKKWVNKTRQQV